jgi:hypothetical protein
MKGNLVEFSLYVHNINRGTDSGYKLFIYNLLKHTFQWLRLYSVGWKDLEIEERDCRISKTKLKEDQIYAVRWLSLTPYKWVTISISYTFR